MLNVLVCTLWSSITAVATISLQASSVSVGISQTGSSSPKVYLLWCIKYLPPCGLEIWLWEMCSLPLLGESCDCGHLGFTAVTMDSHSDPVSHPQKIGRPLLQYLKCLSVCSEGTKQLAAKKWLNTTPVFQSSHTTFLRMCVHQSAWLLCSLGEPYSLILHKDDYSFIFKLQQVPLFQV